MEKKVCAIVCGLCLVFLTSCVNIVEEIFLRKDGSGRFELTFDMSAMLGLKQLYAVRQNILGRVDSADLAPEKYDSVIYFSNMADSIKRRLKNPELFSRAAARIRVDEKNGIADLTLHFPFTGVEEITEFLDDINRFTRDSVRQKGVSPFFAYAATFKASRGSIERSTTILKVNTDDQFDFISKAFFTTARVKTIYHLPRRVKSTTIDGALVNGNECQIELTYPEFISGRKSLDGKIFYR